MPKRRRLYLLLVAYLFATGGGAWLAYSFGVSRSLAAFAPVPAPGHTLAQGWVDNTEVVWSCDGFLGFTGLPAVHVQRRCGPGGGASKTPASRLAGGGHLTSATVRKIAGGRPRASAALMEVPRPTAVAGFVGPDTGETGPLGPVFAPAPSLPGFSAFGGPGPNGSGAPGGNPGAGLPGVLLGGGDFDLPPDGPEGPEGPETPVDPLVTPLPGAAPLLLTGLAGIAGLRRRRPGAQGHAGRG